MKQQITCLLVDIDRHDQQIFTNAMDQVAPETDCFIASDGAEAIQILEQGDVRPDYIFMDISTPGTNGCEFLRTVKDMPDLSDTPVVVHATTARPKEMEDLMKLGAFGIHLKEYTYENICRMLSKYLTCLQLT